MRRSIRLLVPTFLATALFAIPSSANAAWTDLGYTSWPVGYSQAHGCSSYNRADDYMLTVFKVKNVGAARWVHAVVYRPNSPVVIRHERTKAAAGSTVSLRISTLYGSGQDVAVIVNKSKDHSRTPHASSGARHPGSLARC